VREDVGMADRRVIAALALVLATLSGCTDGARVVGPPTAGRQPAAPAAMPPGASAGVAVFDRRAGAFSVQRDSTVRFPSASLVKLLIALDHLWDRGPDYTLADDDRQRFEAMLRSSDNDAATYFYQLNGEIAVITRMIGRLDLQDTAPPSDGRTTWGATVLSAADMVRVYQYILDAAPDRVRTLVMDNLRQATRCGTDGFDQSFGIRAAFGEPSAVKQGWNRFAGTPVASGCTRAAASGHALPVPEPDLPAGRAVLAAAPGPDGVDWTGEVLHTTGTVGAGDRSIVVVLTAHPVGTPYGAAAAVVTDLVRSLPVPR
jgi:hypothetical protein